jgi:subtilisin family serine protease
MKRSLAIFVVAALGLGATGFTATGAAAGTIHPALQSALDQAPADQLVSVIVHLTEQAPIARLDGELQASRASRLERHREIVLALQNAARAQEPLRRDLADGRRDGTVAGYTGYWIANLIVVQALPAQIERLAARPDVASVELNFTTSLVAPIASDLTAGDGPQRDIGVTPGLRAVRAPEVWYDLGYDGTGRLVGSLDTGVDYSHPALASRWRGNQAPWQSCWLDVLDGGTVVPTDHNGHGTHTTGTMTGVAPNDTIGVAWAAQWIACNAIGQSVNPGFDNDIVAAFQWFTDPDGDPFTIDDVPDVVQNSWGVTEGFPGYSDCDSRWWAVIDNCEAAGVVLLFSAGNSGPNLLTIGSPADRGTTAVNCFAVGAVDATNYDFPYPIASFSSRGPTGCTVPGANRVKPELVAPGVHVYSSVPSGGYSANWDGTSMAGPHVAGVVALMRQADPDLDVTTLKTILLQTARDEGGVGEDNFYGWGFLDARAAVEAVIAGFGSLTGTVRNSSHQDTPIAGAEILLVDHGYLFRADTAGVFRGRAAPGFYTARASAPGFVPQETFVEIVGNEVTVADFALTDASGPAITGVTTPVAAAAADGPHNITAEIADASGVASAQLFYRSDGGAWTAVAMTAARGTYAGLLPAAAANTRLDYYVRATDGVGLASTEPADAPAAAHTLWVCETVFADSAEDPGLPGWQLGVAGDGATSGIWVRGNPTGTFEGDLPVQPEDDHTPDPGVACFLTGNCQPGDPASTNDVSGGCTTLVSPTFDLTGADLAFFEHQRWYAKAGSSFDDELALDVSNDGGATWTALERVGSSQPAWTRAVPELGAVVPLTGQMKVRLVACDLNAFGVVEAALDDVRLLVFRAVLTAAPEPAPTAARFALQPAQPNPFNPSTRLSFDLPEASAARLRMYDLSGRLVRTLVDEATLAPGRHEATWDGRDDAGRAVAAGVYLGRLEAAGQQASQRVVLVK